jgi:hypothetical protein
LSFWLTNLQQTPSYFLFSYPISLLEEKSGKGEKRMEGEGIN